jgi:hypothetical protein
MSFTNDAQGPLSTGTYDRSSLYDEAQRPEVQNKIASMLQGEIGLGAPLNSHRAMLETLTNRALARGTSLWHELNNGYYPPQTFRNTVTPQWLSTVQTDIYPHVFGGSNFAQGATGNASSTVAQHQYQKGTPGFNIPAAGGQSESLFNEEGHRGWKDTIGGQQTAYTPLQPKQQPQMSNTYLAQALGGAQQKPLDPGNLSDWAQAFAGNQGGGGMSPLERAGIYLMSIGNPSALAGLSAGSRDAEQRNQMLLRLMGLQQNETNRNEHLMERVPDPSGDKDINGTPKTVYRYEALGLPAPNQSAVAAAANTGLPSRQTGQPAQGGGQQTPAPAQQPIGGGQAPVNQPAGSGAATSMTQNQHLQQISALGALKTAGGFGPDNPEPGLNLIPDPDLRSRTQQWGEGGYNPDIASTRSYAPMDQLARQYATSIYGEKSIENAWKTTQARNTAYTKMIDPTVTGSVANKLLAADNINSNLYIGKPGSAEADEKLPLTEMYDKLGNLQTGSLVTAYGWDPSHGRYLPIPGINSHLGPTGDYVGAYEKRAANYMVDVLRLRIPGNGTGSAEERTGSAGGGPPTTLGEPGPSVFNVHQQPNEMRNTLKTEVGQNMEDLKNLKSKAVEALGGKVLPDGSVTGKDPRIHEIADNIQQRIDAMHVQHSAWLSSHPQQAPMAQQAENYFGNILRNLVYGPNSKTYPYPPQ